MGMYDSDEYRQMKREVKEAYPSDSWNWRVDHMKPNQVIAIWNNIKKRKAKRDTRYKQVSLFDLYPEAMIVGGKK